MPCAILVIQISSPKMVWEYLVSRIRIRNLSDTLESEEIWVQSSSHPGSLLSDLGPVSPLIDNFLTYEGKWRGGETYRYYSELFNGKVGYNSIDK